MMDFNRTSTLADVSVVYTSISSTIASYLSFCDNNNSGNNTQQHVLASGGPEFRSTQRHPLVSHLLANSNLRHEDVFKKHS